MKKLWTFLVNLSSTFWLPTLRLKLTVPPLNLVSLFSFLTPIFYEASTIYFGSFADWELFADAFKLGCWFLDTLVFWSIVWVNKFWGFLMEFGFWLDTCFAYSIYFEVLKENLSWKVPPLLFLSSTFSYVLAFTVWFLLEFKTFKWPTYRYSEPIWLASLKLSPCPRDPVEI